MPRVNSDPELAALIGAFVRDQYKGNKAAAGRSLGVPRPQLYRALRGDVTRATSLRLRQSLHAVGFNAPELDVTVAPIPDKQVEIPDLAVQVLQFITKAVQRASRDERSRADG